jgi:peptidoglycan L-alanyl-D-glutamate endopeptidase CwlK
MNRFSKSSKSRLDTCHPSLRDLFTAVLKRRDITIACGYRGPVEQDKAYADGKSQLKWPQSKHNQYPSRAVDVVPYPELWSSEEALQDLSVIIKEEAVRLGINVTWGGDWHSFKDLPHWELKR